MSAGLGFRHPRSFRVGATAVTAGVLLHIPMFVRARSEHYMLRGMPWDRWMLVGMALIVVGFCAVVHGIGLSRNRGRDVASSGQFAALDVSRLTPAHLKLLLVMLVAVAIDTQKPFVFTFILPGVADEYGLSTPTRPAPGHLPVALFPLVAILATTIGSLVWGYWSDRLGRRATILVVATMFIGTSACGAMPTYTANLVMCSLMGFGVGGLLPVVYSLLAETMPAQRRGQLIVLVAGSGTAVGFLLTSWAAAWLIPIFGWRIMWFLGVPSGVFLVALNRYIPESPRFLIACGRHDAAAATMRRLGIVVLDGQAGRRRRPERHSRGSFSKLWTKPFRASTTAVVAIGIAWGLGNFGFLVWLPTHLTGPALAAHGATDVLARAALFAMPGSAIVAWLYRRWGSRATLLTAQCIVAATLGIFAGLGNRIPGHPALFTAMIVLFLIGLWALVATLAPYAAEIYPTAVRGIGSGIASGATKLGGVLALAMSVFAVAPPDLTGAALLAAVPAVVSAGLLAASGVETSGRALEAISPDVDDGAARALHAPPATT